MNALQRKQLFEAEQQKSETEILRFKGVDGFDVYNCSQPFNYEDKWYLFGRVERRSEWMRSWVRLFEKVEKNCWKLVEDSMVYQLEDPYIAKIDNNLVMGGTHVQVKKEDKLEAYFGYFYYGQALNDLKYFTTGPRNMKDIRIVQLADGRIGVFSRPRDKQLIKEYGSEALIGFTIIDHLDELTAEKIANAKILPDLFGNLEWGGVNQVFLLDTNKIGVIGHLSYLEEEQSVYTVMSFVFDPLTLAVDDYKIIATRKSYPEGPAKREHLKDCCFPSGMIYHDDENCELFSGIGDTQEGVVKITYPFKGYGQIVNPVLKFS
ncbi:DUF1861 family protein [Enterococcus sp. BWB1-3]|uniref:DUF1861 family protein n=1 Tax=unclassified Enterococcus TaxID=2608891 RepID=UPI00192511F7|nr:MULTISPECIES: DUF1861 family protein [unclassified Enterococcus]MBL1229489.1 DUF1861 family protein [Enterococcus sp. BWB1-3]MCB5955840.1 DUF1861 family protein [Enterococcus sp. CWB-B31]